MSGDAEDRILQRLRELEERVDGLDEKVEAAAQLYSLARHRFRRMWLRPPLWTFEQYAPRPLTFHPSYAAEKVPRDPPSIAIATPSYNYGKYLRATIDSVLLQAYPRLRYHVQDAASTDGSVDLLRSYGSQISWHSEKDTGQTPAVNLAFTGVEEDIMAYLNSDDVLVPGTLAFVARAFRERPDIDLVYGHRIFIDSDGMEVGRAVLPRHDARAIFWADFIPQETLFWRRRVWDKIGPFNEEFNYAFDWDFILRAQDAGFKFLRLPRFLACFRVHDEQKTAVLYERGRREMQRLRRRYLGREPSQAEIVQSIYPYLARQLAVHLMYKWGALRH